MRSSIPVVTLTGLIVGALTVMVGIIAYALIASLLAQTNLFLDGGTEVLLDMQRHYLPAGALLGAVLAACIAPIVKRRARVVGLVAFATLLLTPIAMWVASTGYYWVDSVCCMRKQDPSELNLVYANYTPDMIASVDFDGTPLGLEFAPLRQNKTVNAKPAAHAYLAGGVYTPFWRAGQQYPLRWHRYAPGSSIATVVSATASLPPYLGSRHKAFVIYFLPDDKIRIEAQTLDRSEDEVPLRDPPQDAYVAQGKVVG